MGRAQVLPRCSAAPVARRGAVIAGSLAATCAAVAVAHPAGDPRPLPVGAVAAGATVTREQGIEFVTITAPGNAAWGGTNPPTLGDRAVGRGRVDYEYRIGRYEVTSAQLREFALAAGQVPGGVPFLGGSFSTTNPLSPASMTWRTAAIYCNWLHNDKGTTRDAFMSGAYEVSTFGWSGPRGDIFTDQAARSPGARFFIPTWDEWLKATHYDPNRLGPGQGGWWTYANGLDRAAIPGLPGVGEANIGSDNRFVDVGAYASVMSPWGLFDTAGGMREWTESITTLTTGDRYRNIDGSSWSTGPGTDYVGNRGDEFPSFNSGNYGFRIAAAVPAPSSVGGIMFIMLAGFRRRRC